jgi:hypothetical protein
MAWAPYSIHEGDFDEKFKLSLVSTLHYAHSIVADRRMRVNLIRDESKLNNPNGHVSGQHELQLRPAIVRSSCHVRPPPVPAQRSPPQGQDRRGFQAPARSPGRLEPEKAGRTWARSFPSRSSDLPHR